MSESFTAHLESHPPIPPEPPDPGPPMTLERPHSLSGLGVCAMVLIWLVVLADLALDVDAWLVYSRAQDVVGVMPVTALSGATQLSFVLAMVWAGIYIVAGTVFMAWLWFARTNSEQLSRARHIRSRGWVWGGWFVPIVRWWFPFQVVRDVWKASRPGAAPAVTIVGVWWAMFVAMGVVNIALVAAGLSEDTGLATIATLETVSTAVSVVAATLVTLIIAHISRWQESRLFAA